MKKTFLAIFMVLVLIFSVIPGMAADTVTVTKSLPFTTTEGKTIERITWTWTTDDGTVDISTSGTITKITGRACVVKAIIGVPAPVDDYDVEIFDENSIDILHAGGADFDDGSTQIEKNDWERDLFKKIGYYPLLFNSTLKLKVSNVGDTARSGVVILDIIR